MTLGTDWESAAAGAQSQPTRKLHSSHNLLGTPGAETVLCPSNNIFFLFSSSRQAVRKDKQAVLTGPSSPSANLFNLLCSV